MAGTNSRTLATPLAKGEFEEALTLRFKKSMAEVPPTLAEAIRYSLLAPGTHVRPRVLLASAQMVSVSREAALPAALALEMLHCSALMHDDLPFLGAVDTRRGQPASHKKFGEALTLLAGDSLLSLAIEVFLEAAPHVEPENFIRGLGRFTNCSGPSGIIGGQAERRELSAESSIEDLKRVNAKRAASLFIAALSVPKDFAGISDDSSQGLALDIFARELGLAFQSMDDFKRVAQDASGKDISPSHILYYLPLKDAKSMVLQRLNSAILSLSSSWGPPSGALVQIAEEISREIQNSPEE